MTEKSATDELRRLLDERGVEYETDERNAITEWSTYYGAFVYFARQREGKLLVETTVATKHSVILTPEQAIAATLGDDAEAVAFCKRIEKAAKGREPLTVFGVDYSATLGGDENRISERLRGVASDMRNVGASSMTPHELFAYWAREVDKAADLADFMCGVNPDGLPYGLTISDDGNLLDWRGENYVKQSTLGSGTLTAEQVREAIEKRFDFDVWVPPARWQAIADELNAERDEWKAKLAGLNAERHVETCEMEYQTDGMMRGWWKCSVCGEAMDTIKACAGREKPKYCGNCGRLVVA